MGTVYLEKDKSDSQRSSRINCHKHLFAKNKNEKSKCVSTM